jgi:hypothetical protein
MSQAFDGARVVAVDDVSRSRLPRVILAIVGGSGSEQDYCYGSPTD